MCNDVANGESEMFWMTMSYGYVSVWWLLWLGPARVYTGLAQSLQQSLVHLQLAPHLHWSPWQPEQTQGQQFPLQSASHLQVPGAHVQLAVEGGREGG